MPEYDDTTIEAGKEIIRAEGINYIVFKNRVANMLDGWSAIDEDNWVHLYNSYAFIRAKVSQPNISIEEWVNLQFAEYNLTDYDFALKDKV